MQIEVGVRTTTNGELAQRTEAIDTIYVCHYLFVSVFFFFFFFVYLFILVYSGAGCNLSTCTFIRQPCTIGIFLTLILTDNFEFKFVTRIVGRQNLLLYF